MEFAFTVLALTLYGLALWFGYRQARSEFRTALKNAMRRHNVQMKALENRAKLAELNNDEFARRLTILEALSPREAKTTNSHSPDPFTKMEQAAASKLRQVVSVNGRDVVPGAK